MTFQMTKKALILSETDCNLLKDVKLAAIKGKKNIRANIILLYTEGKSISQIAEIMETTKPKVNRCVNKALAAGVERALSDNIRTGRPPKFTNKSQEWILSLYASNPSMFGYVFSNWTIRKLLAHVRANCVENDHACLKQISLTSLQRIIFSQQK